MRRSDWIGLVTSLVLHALVLGLLSFVDMVGSEPQSLGYIEVALGEFSEGRPVQEESPIPATEEEEAPAEAQTEPPSQPETPDVQQPVDLPDEPVDSEEQVEEPRQDEEAEPAPPAPDTEPTPPTSGTTEDGAGAEQAEEGRGEDEERARPFDIEGLDRIPRYTPNPDYTEKVNATLRFTITVDPKGRVVSVIPLQKGSADLERSVREELLQNWRFNALPPNAPQKNQIGTITFRFRLE